MCIGWALAIGPGSPHRQWPMQLEQFVHPHVSAIMTAAMAAAMAVRVAPARMRMVLRHFVSLSARAASASAFCLAMVSLVSVNLASLVLGAFLQGAGQDFFHSCRCVRTELLVSLIPGFSFSFQGVGCLCQGLSVGVFHFPSLSLGLVLRSLDFVSDPIQLLAVAFGPFRIGLFESFDVFLQG